jgi:hypothetical protein
MKTFLDFEDNIFFTKSFVSGISNDLCLIVTISIFEQDITTLLFICKMIQGLS